MILSIRLKNFFSIKEEAVLDFTADMSTRKNKYPLAENLLTYDGEKFVNIIGLFGSNAAGKSNMIKGINFCRNLILSSHLNNEGDEFAFDPYKFEKGKPSIFCINFVSEGTEYEYNFEILGNTITKEALFYFPNHRKARIFERFNTHEYKYGKGLITRPKEIETNTGSNTLFLSRASSMNRPIARAIYRFFLEEIIVGLQLIDFEKINIADFEEFKPILLKALEVSDSDIVNIEWEEKSNGQIRLLSYHRENPDIPFDFEREESEGTKRLLSILILLLHSALKGSAIFIDEFDLKLHIRLAEFILDVIRASRKAQLVFTSHNPSLINTNMLRREQIVFVNKQTDGNSEFVSLSEYEGLSNTTDVQKAYLQGRFDAVPYIGNVYSILKDLMACDNV